MCRKQPKIFLQGMTKVKHMHDIFILGLDLNLAKKACPVPKTLAIIIISKISDVLIKWHEGDHLALNVTFVATSSCRNEKVYLDSHRRHPPPPSSLPISIHYFFLFSSFPLAIITFKGFKLYKQKLSKHMHYNDECLQNDTRNISEFRPAEILNNIS